MSDGSLRRWHAVVGILICLALVAAACSSTDDTATRDATSSTTALTTGSPSTGGPTTAAAIEGSTAGLTDDEIRVAVLPLDLGVVSSAGIDLGIGDPEEQFRVFLDRVNEEGASAAATSTTSSSPSIRSTRRTSRHSASPRPRISTRSSCS